MTALLETKFCGNCGAPVYRVTSHKGKRFFVDVEPAANGVFALEGETARYIPPGWNPDPTNRYRPHKITCPGPGRSVEKAALQRTLAKAREGL